MVETREPIAENSEALQYVLEYLMILRIVLLVISWKFPCIVAMFHVYETIILSCSLILQQNWTDSID